MLPSRLTICLVSLLGFYEVNCFGNFVKKYSCFANILRYKTFEVDFYLSTRNQVQQKLMIGNFNSDEIDFDPRRMTVVIIPGLTPHLYLDKSYSLRDELINWADVNVIYVDWNEGCASVSLYFQAALNTEYTAIVIQKLFSHFIKTWNGTDKSVENWGPLHFIGLSLGAHVAGQAAELVKRENNLVVDRITGIDPAEPCFDNPDSPLRLRKSHANFVDVIHTDAARTKNSRFGLIDAIGHIDFYVNGGSVQPACGWFSRGKRTPNYFFLGYHLTVRNGFCHHLRSLELFTESLRQAVKGQCIFWAYPWDMESVWAETSPRGMDTCDLERCIEMGISATLYRNKTGVYYVPTTGESPYCNY